MNKVFFGLSLFSFFTLVTTPAYTDSDWNLAGSGSWNNPASWSPVGVPSGASVTFKSPPINTPATITLSSPGTAFNINLLSSFPCTITGSPITLSGGDIFFYNTTHTIDAPISCATDIPIVGDGQGSLILNGNINAMVAYVLPPAQVAFKGINTFTSTSMQGDTLVQVNNPASFGGAASPVGFLLANNTIEGIATTTIPQPIQMSNSPGFFSATAGTTMTLSGIISGGGQFVKNGPGTIALTNAGNSYTGGTLFNAGALEVDNSTYFGSNNTLTFNGGALRATNSFTLVIPPVVTQSTAIFEVTSGTFSLSSLISGAGSIQKSGPSIMDLTNASNSYTGGTIINAGTLRILSNAPLAAGGITFTGGILDVVNPITIPRAITMTGSGTVSASGGALTLSGVISGAGTLTLQGTGPITLSGTNTQAGTTVNNTTLKVASQSNIGSSSGTFTLNQATFQPTASFTSSSNRTTQLLNVNIFQIDPGLTVTMNGPILGTGRFNKTGTGTLVLNGTNGYAGPTTITAGTLQGTTSSLTGDITNNSALVFSQLFSGTYAGNISGSGTLTKLGSGTSTLTGTSSYSGGTTVSEGTLAGTTNSLQGAISVAALAITEFDQSFNGTYAGVISGMGNVTKDGSGTLIFSGLNTYSGITLISGGALQISSNSIQSTVVDNSSLIFNQTTPGTFTPVISGFGSVQKIGTDVLTLAGLNTYSGGTTVSQGTLVGTTNSLQGAISASSSTILEFNQNFNGTYAGAISGAGSVTKDGTGTVIFSGVNSYSGTTLISGGTLEGSSSSIASNVVNNAALIFNQNTNGTFSGMISGTGTLEKTGTAVLGLTGLNTYAGGTTVSQGTLEGTTNSLQGNISTASSTILEFNQSFDGTYAGVISGMGSVTKAATGTVIFSGVNSYSGPTLISRGTLEISSGSIVSNVVNNDTLRFNQNADGTFSQTITGTGTLEKTGTAVLTLTGLNTYTGGTAISQGTLRGTTQTIPSGNIFNDATLEFDQTINGTFSGNILGVGQLVKEGTGSVTLTGANEYFGPTFVNAGTLQGDTLSLQGDFDITGTLIFNQNFDGQFVSDLSGAGNLQKLGSGVLYLTGAYPLTGPTTVSGGTVSLNGSLAGNITIDAGAKLKGNCTAINLINHGTLSPGNSIGVMNYTNFTQGSTGNLIVEVDPNGNSDLINVTNAPSLDGTLTVTPGPGLYEGFEVYTIMTYPSPSATPFSNVVSTVKSTTTVQYLPTSIQIDVGYRGSITPLSPDSLPYNPKQVAGYLFCTGFVPTDPDLKNVMKLLLALPEAQFAKALDELDPRQFGAIPQVELQNHHLFADQLVTQAQTSRWCCPSENETTIWTTPVGQWLSEESYSDLPGFSSQTYGALVGASHRFGQRLHLNGAVSYSHSDLDWKQKSGKGFFNELYLAPSLTYFHRNWHVTTLVQASYSHYSMNRAIEFPGLNRVAHNTHNGYGLLARADGGHKFAYFPPHAVYPINLVPTARVSYYNLFEEGFTESGASSLNLKVDHKHTSYIQPELLIKVYREYFAGSLCIVPSFHLGWIGNYPLSSRLIESQFALDESFCKPNFSVRSYNKKINQMTASLHLLIKEECRYLIDIGYDGRYFDGLLINSAQVTFEYKF